MSPRLTDLQIQYHKRWCSKLWQWVVRIESCDGGKCIGLVLFCSAITGSNLGQAVESVMVIWPRRTFQDFEVSGHGAQQGHGGDFVVGGRWVVAVIVVAVAGAGHGQELGTVVSRLCHGCCQGCSGTNMVVEASIPAARGRRSGAGPVAIVMLHTRFVTATMAAVLPVECVSLIAHSVKCSIVIAA